MSIKVNIFLSQYLSNGVNVNVAEVNGSTVGECLKHLVEQFPKLKLFDKDGELLAYLGVYINGESAYPDELRRPVRDGDELSIIPAVDGG